MLSVRFLEARKLEEAGGDEEENTGSCVKEIHLTMRVRLEPNYRMLHRDYSPRGHLSSR